MAGLVLGFQDLIAVASLSLLHDGAGASSVVSGYPLSNLQTRQLGRPCRILRSGTGTTIIRASFGSSTPYAMAQALCGFRNLDGETNYITFEAYSTSTLRLTSPTYNGLEERQFSTVVADLADQPVVPVNRIDVRIQSADTVAETIQIGRLWYSQAFVSLHGVGNAIDTGPEDSGGTEISRGGAGYPRIGTVTRSVSVELPLLESFETYGYRQGLPAPGNRDPRSTVPLEAGCDLVGKSQAVLAFVDDRYSVLRPIYGHFDELPRITGMARPYHSATLRFREER